MNDNITTREDLADRLMDLALAEKAGGNSPPDLSEQILARAAAQVGLPDSRRTSRAYGSFVPVGVSLCLLALACVAAFLWQPNVVPSLDTASHDGELLKAYEAELADMLVEDAGSLLKAFEEEDAKFLASGDSAQAIILGKIRSEIESGMTAARKKSRSSPETATHDLKLLLNNVERVTGLDNDVRDQLRDQVQSALVEATRRQVEFAETRAKNEEARAAALERNVNSVVPYTVTKSAISRREPDVSRRDREFAKLVAETDAMHRLHGIDGRLAERRDQLVPDVTRYKKQLDTRGIYLDPESREWAELSVRRKKYASMDLGKKGGSETKILAALADPTTAEFDKTPLKDVVDYLKDLHGIDIRIDPKALESAGVKEDRPISGKLKGISLHAALSRVLEPLELSYTVKGEALQITTPEAAGFVVMRVKGEVTAVAGNGRLVEISIGSDDGVREGRLLSAIRDDGIVLERGLRILRTSPDRAVAEIVDAGLKGSVVKGFKVSGKIFDLPPEPEIVPDPVVPVEPDPSGDKFDALPENELQKVKEAPLSTFSIDVDTASYSKVRQILTTANQLPPAEAVRLEELINYFPYDYAGPQDDKPFAAHVETAACPWNGEHRLVRIGLKGKVIEAAKRPACNLVFLVDVSGSMDEPNKLPLVTHGLKMLAGELTDRDTVAIVVYAGAAGMVLPPTSGDAKPTIFTALSQLQAGGSTNGGEGIELAYKTCQENFLEGGVNRVILCTDGDFNVGLTSTGQLVDLAKEKAQKGVFLSALGFGMGNHNDEMLEAVSNKANGNHAFIDSLNEARKVLVEQIGGTLVTIAKDVKIQVEFEAAAVESYRLLGYENRLLADEDFADDKKDAGEIGAGHTVTALYEIVPIKAERKKGATPTRSASEEKILTLKLRYKAPDGDKSALLEFPVKGSGRRFAEATPDFQFAASVASFGMLLRKSKHAGDSNFAAVAEIAAAAKGADPHGYRAEFVELVKKAGELAK